MTASIMRSEPTPERRREVEALASDLPGGCSRELAFDEPWELRAFALAVAAHKTGQFEWSQFQRALITSIKDWGERSAEFGDPSWSYYGHWMNALEDVLATVGVVDLSALDARAQEVLDAPPNRNHHEPHLDPIAVDPGSRQPACAAEEST